MPKDLICPKCKEKPKHCKCDLLMQIKNLEYDYGFCQAHRDELRGELAEAKIIMGNMLNPKYSKTNPFVDAQNFLHKK